MFLKLYFIALPVLFAIDMVWLGLLAKGFYTKHLSFLMSQKVNWGAAVIFYLIFIAGLVFFVIMPAVEKDSLLRAALTGALFGLVCYATYDLTNLATLKNWPLIVTLVDLAWGMFLSAAVAAITFFVNSKI